MRKHNEVEDDIMDEKIRQTKVNRNFAFVDIVFCIVVVSLFLTFQLSFYNSDSNKKTTYLIMVLVPIFLNVTIALLLVFSALFLSTSLRQTTGKKQNTLLLSLHIANLFLLSIVLVSSAILTART